MNSTLRRSLPPLNALRAFEAAARHLSLSLAANELNVTPAAISHQVRLLEDHIGLPVFERNGRGLALTDAGAAGLRDLREAFARLSAAMDAIGSLGRDGDADRQRRAILRREMVACSRLKFVRTGAPGDRRPCVRFRCNWRISRATGSTSAMRYGAGGYAEVFFEKLLDGNGDAGMQPRTAERQNFTLGP